MLLLLLSACGHFAPTLAPELPFEERMIDAAGMARAFPSDRVKDRKGWATDLRTVFAAHEIEPTNGNTCAVVAALEQESGYAPDPAVPGIGGMIDTWIAEKQASMGKLPGWAFGQGLRAVLDAKAKGQEKSFYERLRAAKSERDVDVTFREFVAFHRSKLPAPLRTAEEAAQIVGLDLDDFNPITTAGCLQVKVDFAEDHAREHGTDRALVRDQLYTREGCLHYGVVRLLDWDAGYDKPLYRFADYNAGLYASRNAAFQEQVAALSGVKLALDGDLLRYNEGGRPASEPSQTLTAVLNVATTNALDLPEGRVRRDLSKEKKRAFEETDTWKAIRALYQAKTKKEPVYARLPDVTLDSIKLQGNKTTAWFATNVDRRYQACLARLKAK
ncbi:MAG: DUF1615 family protein [Pseudomonadota bacterium]|nr:DUF1615 family protein [Pseudomonadota bacterium]